MKAVGLVVLFAFLIGCVFFAKSATPAPKTVTVEKPVYIERRVEVPVRVNVPVEKRIKVQKRVEVPVEKKVYVQVPTPRPPVISVPVYTAIPQPVPVQSVNPIAITRLLQNRPQVIVQQGSHFTTVGNGFTPPWTGTCRGIPRGMVRTHR
ncbi:MAG: hypothetical protein ABSG35_14145 [Syntrophobacteraceae bacterium]|jgi:hypothetical protein